MRRIALLAASLLLLSACASEPRLVILHTNDTHSHLEAERGGILAGHGGAIERAAFVDSVRAAMGEDRVLLVHAGDFNQGSSYFSEFGGDVEVSIVNAMGYDCITLGNHEFDNGIEDLGRRLTMINCPVVCANLDLSPFVDFKAVTPYAIIEKAGMKIGIIGLEADLTTNVSKATSSRIPQLDPVEVTDKWACYLKRELKCDLVILLSHQGYEEDQAIAASTHCLDIVIGGHTHTFVDDMVEIKDLDGHAVKVVTDGCWGLEMGEIKVW